MQVSRFLAPANFGDMSADASEQRNLSDEYPQVVERLMGLLEKYKKRRTQQAGRLNPGVPGSEPNKCLQFCNESGNLMV